MAKLFCPHAIWLNARRPLPSLQNLGDSQLFGQVQCGYLSKRFPKNCVTPEGTVYAVEGNLSWNLWFLVFADIDPNSSAQLTPQFMPGTRRERIAPEGLRQLISSLQAAVCFSVDFVLEP